MQPPDSYVEASVRQVLRGTGKPGFEATIRIPAGLDEWRALDDFMVLVRRQLRPVEEPAPTNPDDLPF